MSSKSRIFTVNPANGGLDSTSAPFLVPTGAFTVAENVLYSISGGNRKRPGTARYNATTLGSSTVVGAIADFWRHGTDPTGTQMFVCIAGDTIYKDDGDGVWDSLEAAWSATGREARQNIIIAQGYALFSDGTAAPRKYDQTTDSALANAPVYEFGVYHLRRLFVSGISANYSRVDYCAAGDIETWTGADSGSFIFDEDDGDRVIGISRPFRGNLFVFKGPNVGSIHAIGGATPGTFTKERVLTGAPCVASKSIITTPNDVYWCSKYGFHSLSATAKYGDTEEAFLSRPVQADFDRLVVSRLNQAAGFHHPRHNIIGWAVPGPGATNNDRLFVYNYVRNAWSIWRFGGLGPASVAVMQEPAAGGDRRLPKLYIGGYTGFVYEGDQSIYADNNADTAYNFRLRTPVHYKLSEADTEMTEKQFYRVTTFYRPTGSFNATLRTLIDNRAQTATLDLSGTGDLIGSTFIIGTSLISSTTDVNFRETPIEDVGRGIQLEWSNTDANQDVELYGYGITYSPAESMAQERSN